MTLPTETPSANAHEPSPPNKIKGGISTHRKNHDRLPLALHNHTKIEPDLEPSEGFMDEDIADLGSWDEAGGCGEEVGGGEGGGLDA